MLNAYQIGETLREYSYKMTLQRKAILDIILQNRDKHLSAEEIIEKAKKKNPRIGASTVYRTIRLFEKIGVIQQVFLNDGIMRYHMINPDEKREHHHLICKVCGDVMDVKEDIFEIFEDQIFRKNGFTVTDHRVKIYGICKKCSEEIEYV